MSGGWYWYGAALPLQRGPGLAQAYLNAAVPELEGLADSDCPSLRKVAEMQALGIAYIVDTEGISFAQARAEAREVRRAYDFTRPFDPDLDPVGIAHSYRAKCQAIRAARETATQTKDPGPEDPTV